MLFYRLRYRFARWLLAVLIVLLGGGGRLDAQDLDSRGRDFWIAFMANLGADQISELRLYLSAQRPTTARITWVYSNLTITVPIPTANRTVEVDLNSAFGPAVEMDDVFPTDPYNETMSKAIHIESDDDISVVGLNYRSLSADAFLALPSDVLTGEYVVVSHRNGYSTNIGYDTPSQFCVVGMENGTTVRILPKPGLLLNGRTDSAFVVILDKGDVFFAQAQLYGPADVTGTQVIANKPVSVFAGVKRASIPTRWGNYRDHLVEQLPPLQSWGENALVTPFYPVYLGAADTAEYRITAAFGPTDVTITDATSARAFTLGAGDALEQLLVEAVSVTATGPILVTQYERSTPTGGGNDQSVGDPFMMIIPPVEQFDTVYTVQSIGFAEFLDQQHFLNVIAPLGGVATLTIDGTPPGGANWLRIPGSNYVYAQINVAPGSHYLRADSPFAVYAYGYGYAVSYGYPGAMVFRRLVKDVSPPDILWSQQCGLFQGIATDSRIADSGIDSLYATGDTVNVTVDIPAFPADADTVFFSARLIDPYNDGTVAVRVIDSSGLSYTQKTDIPGFTLGVNGARSGAVVHDTIVAINADEFCRRIAVVNYGKFRQRIVGLELLDTIAGTRVTTPMPMTIDPGDTGMIEICFTGLGDTMFTMRLGLEGVCTSRLAAIIPVESRIDTTGAGIGREGSACSDEVIVVYTKSERASRIASVEVDTLVNCESEVLNDPQVNPLPVVRVRLRRVDPHYDMIYQITVVDSVGNRVVDRDTVGGFTIGALGAGGDSVGVRWDREWVVDTLLTSTRRCDSIELVNYGQREVELTRVRLRGNVKYSVPPSQLPMRIESGGRRKLRVCLESPYPYDQVDTLELWDGCWHAMAIAMKTPSSVLLGGGSEGCEGRIEVSVYEAAKRTFMTAPAPNPMGGGGGYVDIGLTGREEIDLEVYDLWGRSVGRIARGATLPGGVMRVRFDVGGLSTGSYVIQLRTSSGESVTQRLMIAR